MMLMHCRRVCKCARVQRNEKSFTTIIIVQSVWSGNKQFFDIQQFHPFFSSARTFWACTRKHTKKNINQSLVIRICNACQRPKQKLTFISYLPYCFFYCFLRWSLCVCAHQRGKKRESPLWLKSQNQKTI